MLHVYINYPNPKVSVHYDGSCPFIRMTGKQGQRQVTINVNSIASELLKFQAKEYRFGSAPINNDMWLIVDLKDNQREIDTVRNIQQLVGSHYKPLQKAEIQVHCSISANNNLGLRDQHHRVEEHVSEIERKLRQLEERIKSA